MRRGTTPDYELSIAGQDLRECSVFVTLSQYKTVVTLTNDRLTITYDDETDVSTIVFRLTQEETLTLKPGSVEMQVRFIDSDGVAEATEIQRLPVATVLNEDVIEYGLE